MQAAPARVLVSSFFEMSKRGRIFGDNPYENRQPVFDGSLEEFIQRQEGGFDTILEYFNIWANNRHIPRGFLLVRYEDIKADPKREPRRVLTFLGMPDISDQTIEQAVEYASFENMRKMEANGKFQTAILNPANIADQDSYKARKGKVHGYADYLNINEILVLDQKIQTKLSDYFGYRETGVQLIGKDNH